MPAIEDFIPLNIAIATLSDTRSSDSDASGDYLAKSLSDAGHLLSDRSLIKDDKYQIRAVLSDWIVRPDIQVVITTGGTGLTGRDSTPEAMMPLMDKKIDGFGELFRRLSYQEIGAATLQSRAIAGLANGTVVFCLPGSTNACRLGWEKIIAPQLNSQTKPCNLAALIPRFKE